MADTYRAPRHSFRDSSLARRPARGLNPIMEEESEGSSPARPHPVRDRHADLKIEAWLSPMSDHFPTPRGIHYLPAPVLPSSPSTETVSTSPSTWNRDSIVTDATEFEDLYDFTDDDEMDELIKMPKRRSSVRVKSDSRRPPSLVIPESKEAPVAEETTWSAVDELKKIVSPVPLTPSVKLTMSPAQLDFMDQQQSMDIPTISAPPSLDGSLTSEQLALMSAPPTPAIDDEEANRSGIWSGVQLQPGALATLRSLSSSSASSSEVDPHEHRVLEVPHTLRESQPVTEMQQQPLQLFTNFRSSSLPSRRVDTFEQHRESLADLTKLDIPSPGGFFSALSPQTRDAWNPSQETPLDSAPPTSTTAEQFYKCPWNAAPSPAPKRNKTAEDFYKLNDFAPAPAHSQVVEQVIEIGAREYDEDDQPTALPITARYVPQEALASPAPVVDDAPNEIVVDYDPAYARKQQKEALSHLDRTGQWLMAQRAYLPGIEAGFTDDEDELDAIPEAEEIKEEEEEESKETEVETEQALITRKKTVRFTIQPSVSAQPKDLPSIYSRQESAYYRAFQDYIIRSRPQDVFIHQLARFEALQAQRVSLRAAHHNQLLGKYQLSVIPQSAKKRLSANVARDDHNLVDDIEKLRHDKEVEAMEQMAASTWHVAAMKLLAGGRLISAPVTKRLARLSRMAPGQDGTTRDRARILDLGGQATCDWAWHVALQFPNTKIYTVTTKAIRQLSNSNIRGPPNHRQVAVERLTRLPFADNQFDLISARELHSILKLFGENGEDEWNSCLNECMRVLKPGGFLEFSLLDADIINAGPVGLAKSVEFGFTLKTLGYDPNPSKLWLGRLARAGFQDVRRTWMALPMGPKSNAMKPPMPPPKDNATGLPVKVCQLDAMVMGSGDNIASACSILGAWSWERWLLRCETEKAAGELRLADIATAGPAMKEAGKSLEGVSAVIEEGRNKKSCFRMLNGYAMKPRPGTELIQIALDM